MRFLKSTSIRSFLLVSASDCFGGGGGDGGGDGASSVFIELARALAINGLLGEI